MAVGQKTEGQALNKTVENCGQQPNRVIFQPVFSSSTSPPLSSVLSTSFFCDRLSQMSGTQSDEPEASEPRASELLGESHLFPSDFSASDKAKVKNSAFKGTLDLLQKITPKQPQQPADCFPCNVADCKEQSEPLKEFIQLVRRTLRNDFSIDCATDVGHQNRVHRPKERTP